MLFSIIIPTYNYADYLQQALQSLLLQFYDNFEVIVVDDGSTDHTQAILSSMASQFGHRLTVLTQINAGPGAARNCGIAAAKGQYCLFLDADDTLKRDALMHFRKAISDFNQPDCIIAGHTTIEGKVIKNHPGSLISLDGRQNLIDYLNKKITVCNGAMVIARKYLNRIYFPSRIRICEDIPVFMQVIACLQCYSIKHSVVNIQKHPGSRRHQIDALADAADRLPGLVFNSEIMPEAYFDLKPAFAARMACRVFRGLYQAKRFDEARQYYYRALKLQPKLVFTWLYTKKYLKSLLRLKKHQVTETEVESQQTLTDDTSTLNTDPS